MLNELIYVKQNDTWNRVLILCEVGVAVFILPGMYVPSELSSKVHDWNKGLKWGLSGHQRSFGNRQILTVFRIRFASQLMRDLVRDLLSHVVKQCPLVAQVLITTLNCKLKRSCEERSDYRRIGTDHEGCSGPKWNRSHQKLYTLAFSYLDL